MDLVAGRGDPASDGGVPDGRLLVRFADAALGGTDAELESIRGELVRRLGVEALVDAAAVVGIFSCNVRVADASGVPLDEAPTLGARIQVGVEVGIRRFEEPAAAGPERS